MPSPSGQAGPEVIGAELVGDGEPVDVRSGGLVREGRDGQGQPWRRAGPGAEGEHSRGAVHEPGTLTRGARYLHRRITHGAERVDELAEEPRVLVGELLVAVEAAASLAPSDAAVDRWRAGMLPTEPVPLVLCRILRIWLLKSRWA